MALVRAIAAGDQVALHSLYERSHRVVFTLILRMTCSRETAEELTLEVFHEVWRRAYRYEPRDGTVLGWLMNQARFRALARLGAAPRKKYGFEEERRALRTALDTLIAEERQVIEAAFFCELTQLEVAIRLKKPLARIRASLYSGLHKLREALAEGGEEPMSAWQACEHAERVCAYVLRALPSSELRAIEAHLPSCAHCRRELESLGPVVDALACWPTDVLRPAVSLQERLAHRIALDSGEPAGLPGKHRGSEPQWEDVAPGISCKVLASDLDKHVVSMLVRLAPGGEYPPHTHAGVEELHLLEGELWIDERKLHPGDYNRAEPGTFDRRVWSETGCTCVLMTSTRDVLS
ncbi:MAG: cupin domain-containing protein [Burkholderiales bacterium]